MKAALPGRIVCSTLQTIIALVLGLAVGLPLPIAVNADPGDLDPTFGDNGKVVTILGQRSEWANDMIVQADGKTLVIGSSQDPGRSWAFGLVLARHNADGTLDASFGDGGKVATVFDAQSAWGAAITLQADGKIVAAGDIGGYGERDFLVARFNVGGSPDASFGADGIVTTDFSRMEDLVSAVAIQSDGKIIVGGTTRGSDGNVDFALARYNVDGALDPAFGNQGTVITDLGSDDIGNAIAIQADGKIILAGTSADDFAAARYGSDGAPDPTFGVGGIVTTDFGAGAAGIAIQPDGKIVMAGTTYTDTGDHRSYDLALARCNMDGSWDSTFGEEGLVTTDFSGGDDYGRGVIIQADGRIVVVGRTEASSGFDFALARYNADGSQDRTFGAGGTVATDFAGGRDSGAAITVQVDGKIVVAGSSDSSLSESYTEDLALARYDPDGSLDTDFGIDGTVTSDLELGNSWVADVAVQADGKTIVAGRVYNGRHAGWDSILVRYNLDGYLDQSFGTKGIALTDVAAAALMIQSDGTIVVVGGAEVDGSTTYILVHYKPDGSLDTAFGDEGKIVFEGQDYGGTVAFQPDDKIVTVGITESGAYAVARYDPDGSLDSNFGVGGVVLLDFGSTWLGYPDVLVQTDNKIIVTGTGATRDPDFALTRLNPDGSRDTSFGAGKTVTTDFGGWDRGGSVAVQSDGKIIMTGVTDGRWGDFALACYNPDGSLNSGFGIGGIVTTDFDGSSEFSSEWVYAAAIQVDGKILVAGYTDAYQIGSGDFALARYQHDGALDPTFGNEGTVATDFGSDSDDSLDWASEIALQAQGKILVVGRAMSTFALARYQGWDRVLTTYLPVIVQASGQQAGRSQ